jgi:hypothetical protein
MNLLPFLRSLTPLARWILIGLVAALLIGGTVTLRSCQAARTAKTETRLSNNQTGAAIASGADAANTVGDVGARAAETDRTTLENADEIRSAPGADAPVNTGVHGAGLRSLCKRAAYRGRPECMQLAPSQ